MYFDKGEFPTLGDVRAAISIQGKVECFELLDKAEISGQAKKQRLFNLEISSTLYCENQKNILRLSLKHRQIRKEKRN